MKMEKMLPVPGIILDSEQSIRRFSRSIARQEQAKKRSNSFKASEFKIENYIELLKGHNAKVEL